MDERSNMIMMKSMAIVLALLYFGLVTVTLFKYITSGDITAITTELMLIIIIPMLIAWFARKNESLVLPRHANGEPLQTEEDTDAKHSRRIHYLLESLGFATFCLLLSIADGLWIQKSWDYFTFSTDWSKTANIAWSLSIEFVMLFVIFAFISFVFGELSIKRYNKKIDQLED